MPIPSGTSLGPYQITVILGAGGMGEVYRAKDTRLDRIVAVKVLPPHLSTNEDLRRRFEQEARAVSGLNHPHICSLYDIGFQNETHYLVMEYLEGETLRARLNGGSLSLRKAVEFAVQIASALSVAHEKGIVHRDLKPENIFITREERVKLLDFGLAHYAPTESVADVSITPTRAKMTEPGMVMGTVGYMSPEQVRGQEIDSRSDIFSLGTVLYEMLTGQAPFARETSAETMTAILKEDPSELQGSGKNIPPGVVSIVHRCMEKKPDLRFQTAKDLAFALQMTSQSTTIPAIQPEPVKTSRSKQLLWPLLALLLLVAGVGYFLNRRSNISDRVAFRQLTFRRGYVQSAFIAPDGHTVIYSALLGGEPSHLFTTRTDSVESRQLDLSAPAELLGISQNSEMAILLNPRYHGNWVRTGTLARAPIVGGTPREILENVLDASFAPDGTNFIISRSVGALVKLEYPIGKVLYETNGWINCPRISTSGKIAFLDHPIWGDDRGFVALFENGKVTRISHEHPSVDSLAWSPDGKNLFFSASQEGDNNQIWSLHPGSPERVLLRAPTRMRLHSIERNGDVLLTTGEYGSEIGGVLGSDPKERDLSWYGDEDLGGISDDGNVIAATQLSEGSGANYQTYFRKADGSGAVSLGEGASIGISPDGKFILSVIPSAGENQFVIYPTGPGESRKINLGNVAVSGADNHASGWSLDGRYISFLGKEPGKPQLVYVYDLQTNVLKAVSNQEVTSAIFSPDCKSFIAVTKEGKPMLHSISGDHSHEVMGLQPGDALLRWEKSGNAIFVSDGSFPTNVFKIDLSTGTRELWKHIAPADPIGVVYGVVILSPDGNHYAYRYRRILNHVYLATGLL